MSEQEERIIEQPRKDIPDKKENSYSELLPKHIFPQAEEIKITPREKISEYAYKDIAKDLWGKKKVRYFVIFVLLIILFNFWFLRYDDWLDGCHINIQFSLLDWNNLEVKNAINFIKNKSPDDYKKVCQNVSDIELFLPCDFSAGGCFRDDKPRQIGVYTMRRDGKNQPSYLAAVIVHETCHAIQKAQNRSMDNREPECYRKGYQFLRSAGIPDSEIPDNWKTYN